LRLREKPPFQASVQERTKTGSKGSSRKPTGQKCHIESGGKDLNMVRAMKRSEVEGKRNNRTGIRVKNERRKGRRLRPTQRQIVLIITMLFIFMGSGISYVWSSFEGTQLGYDLSRLKQVESRLMELHQKLKVELATLKSPQNLEYAARDLGLKEASPEQIIILP